MDDAISQYQAALQIKPDDEIAQVNLGIILLQTGRAGEAKARFQTALQLAPSDAKAKSNLAWLLATCPEVSLRDGNKAVALAQQANTLTGGSKPMILHSLAAALAEAGRFPEALETAQRALNLAEAQSNIGLAQQLQIEIKFYQSGRPYHSPEPTH
jgi:Flp pilus assembly protein TadD